MTNSRPQYTIPAPSAQVVSFPKRIDSPWQCLFYVLLWTLIPPSYDRQILKTANYEIVNDYVRQFRSRARAAGLVIGRGAYVRFVFLQLQNSLSIPDSQRARAIMAAYLNSRFTDGPQ